MSHCHFHSFNQYSLSAYCVPDCLLCATTHPGDTCYWLWYVQPSERKIGWTNLCHLTVQGHGPEWLINTSKVTEQVSHNIGTRTQLILVSKSRLPLFFHTELARTSIMMLKGLMKIAFLSLFSNLGENIQYFVFKYLYTSSFSFWFLFVEFPLLGLGNSPLFLFCEILWIGVNFLTCWYGHDFI